MGIVANTARCIPGVLARDNLRERFRFGGIRLVAGHAEFCGVGKDGLLAGEVLRMASKRPMAGFTSDIGMRAFALRGSDVDMTGSAGFSAGENGSAGGDFIERAGAVVSVLAEILGNQGMANRQESQHENNCDTRQPDQVCRTFENLPHAGGESASAPPFPCGTWKVKHTKDFRYGTTANWERGIDEFLRRIALNRSEVLR